MECNIAKDEREGAIALLKNIR